VDDLEVSGLPVATSSVATEYLVLDWINVRRGGSHPYNYIEDEDSDFVKKIVFYPSERIMGRRTTVKDACAVSILTEKQLKNKDYSESYSFLKARDMMTNAGIVGSKNGTQAYNGKPAYLSLKIEVSHRQTFKIHKSTYEDTACVEFDTLSRNEYLSRFSGL